VGWALPVPVQGWARPGTSIDFWGGPARKYRQTCDIMRGIMWD